MKSGIYLIKNIITNQNYVGSSYDIKNRWRQHKWYLKNNKHNNTYLQNSWNKYGEQSFEFSTIIYCSIDELLEKEKQHIYEYNGMIKDGGFNCFDPVDLIRNSEVTDETRKILSESKIGSKNPMYNKKGVDHPKHGYKLSDKSRKELSKKRKLFLGEKSANVKLSNNQVLEIRNKYIPRVYSTTKLAKEYGVTQGTIMNIIKRRGWTHL